MIKVKRRMKRGMKRTVELFFTALTFVGAMSVMAQEVIELDQTAITGDQELPQVLYLVPWQEGETSAQKFEPSLIVPHDLVVWDERLLKSIGE